MIAVAIIGILAAVAIPAYQNYTARARVAEVINIMSSIKTDLYETYATTGQMPDHTDSGVGAEFATNVTAKFAVAEVVGADATTYEIDADDSDEATVSITVTGLPNLTPTTNDVIVFNFVAGVNGLTVVCNGAGTTLSDDYLPTECRG